MTPVELSIVSLHQVKSLSRTDVNAAPSSSLFFFLPQSRGSIQLYVPMNLLIDYNVPFYGNTPDDTHCFQAALRMILKYFYTDEEYSWEELDKITAKEPNLWTWPMAGITWMRNHGLEVIIQESFDYKRFADEGSSYLVEYCGENVAKEQIQHSAIDNERKRANIFATTVQIQHRIPTIEDVVRFLSEKYLVCCNINSYALDNVDQYAGHFIVIKGVQANQLILHDPGLPHQANRVVPFAQFEKAWAYPTEHVKNLFAFKKP